ncbi:molybdopterin-containing oxidoreductase family protein [Minwuia sp.]|uniref:molybdopterin-containing oxidoreductase family protein n=1 Tax=Minwuia sp. TaxID=2493630 RepID=UPI003A904AE0
MSEERKPAFCAQCRSRCGCTAIVEDGRLTGLQPMPEHPSGKALCPKGHASPELVYHPDRLTRPMRRISPKGHAPVEWEAISWTEALDQIADRMGDVRDRFGAEQVAFSVTTGSGTHISDGISWIERFIRAFGSPNTIYSTEICNWHKDFASRFTYGSDIGTPDFANTECALIWGHNPATTWLARSVEIREARGRGTKTIVVDPRRTLYAKRADVWLRVRPGTDQALALGLINLILEGETFDADFVRQWTNAALLVRDDTGALLRQSDLEPGGRDDIAFARADDGGLVAYDMTAREWRDGPGGVVLFGAIEAAGTNGTMACTSVLQLLKQAAAAWSPERTADVTGVAPDRLRAAAGLLTESGSVAYYAWNGVGQSVTATQTDRAISILYSLLGHYGSKGGNVPGAAAPFNDISGHDLVTPEQRAKTLGLADRPLGPGRNGWVTARDTYRAVLEGDPYPVRMLFSFGGNLLSAQPDMAMAKRALGKLDFHVHTDFFLNDAADYADIVLPVSTSWEREALRTGFDASLEGQRRVQLRQAVVDPVGKARSDIEIVLGLSGRLGLSEQMFDGDVDAGHRHVLAPSGIDLDDLRQHPEGIDLDGHVPQQSYRTKGFPTPSGLIELYSETFLQHGHAPLPELADNPDSQGRRIDFPLRLSSAKTVAYCHSQGRNIPALRKLTPDPVVEIAPETAAERGIGAGDWVEIATRDGEVFARAKLVEDQEPDTVVAQHGWTARQNAANGLPTNMNAVLSTRDADPISGSIPLRFHWCEIRPATETVAKSGMAAAE